MTQQRLDDKDPAEVIPVTFDFTELLTELVLTAVDSATVSIAVKYGTDVDVATMLYGSFTIDAGIVTQLVRNGVHNVDYVMQCTAVSGSATLKLTAYFNCRSQLLEN